MQRKTSELAYVDNGNPIVSDKLLYLELVGYEAF